MTGTYRVDGECNVFARLTDKDGVISHIFGTVFDEGNQFLLMYSDDGLVIGGQGKRSVDTGL